MVRGTNSGVPCKARMKLLPFTTIAFFFLMGGCPPSPPAKNACESISIAPIGPGTGSTTVCTTPTDCREDVMTGYIDTAICSDKSKGSCPAGSAACSNTCGGVVNSSGLKVNAGSCTWDRNSECKTSAGGAGSNCTCSWTIPAGSSVSCGCACQ